MYFTTYRDFSVPSAQITIFMGYFFKELSFHQFPPTLSLALKYHAVFCSAKATPYHAKGNKIAIISTKSNLKLSPDYKIMNEIALFVAAWIRSYSKICYASIKCLHLDWNAYNIEMNSIKLVVYER